MKHKKMSEISSLVENDRYKIAGAAESKKEQFEQDNIKIIPIPEYCAEDIKKIRVMAGMTQKSFAAFLNVSQRTVEAWEVGRSHPSGDAVRILQMMEMDKELTMKFPFVQTELSADLQRACNAGRQQNLSEVVQEKLDKHDFNQMLPIIKRLEIGAASPAELSKLIGKSSSTVRRYMETLVKTGCVRKVGSTNRLVYEAACIEEKMILPVIRKKP